MKKLEQFDNLYATFRAAYEVMSEIKTTVFPSMLSLCVPIGVFMNAALEAAATVVVTTTTTTATANTNNSGSTGSNGASGGGGNNGSNAGTATNNANVIEIDIYSVDSLKMTFTECLVKACRFVIGNDNRDSIKAFTEAYQRFICCNFFNSIL